MRNNDFVWTPDRLKILNAMRDRGETRAEIANILGTTERVVKNRLRRVSHGNGLPSPWTPEREQRLRELWNNPEMSASKCADLINDQFNTDFTRNAIIGAVHRRGIKRRKASSDSVTKAKAPAGTKTAPAARAERSLAIEARRQEAARAEEARREEEEILAAAAKAAALAMLVEAAPVPAPVPAAQPSSPPRTGISIFDLKEHTCRWPLGGPRDFADKFCGCQRAADEKGEFIRGVPYCDHHARRAFQPSKRWRDAAKSTDIRALPGPTPLNRVFGAHTN